MTRARIEKTEFGTYLVRIIQTDGYEIDVWEVEQVELDIRNQSKGTFMADVVCVMDR